MNSSSTDQPNSTNPDQAVIKAIDRNLSRVFNTTRNTIVASKLEVADTPSRRSKGLLGRRSLETGAGLWIVPCESVHTFWMKFSIDLIYLDRSLRVKKVRPCVRPWRMSACLSAHSILELPCGTIGESQTAVGDILKIESVADAEL